MARRPIDWRDEFSQLGPYMQGGGGNVRVLYPGETGAVPAFLETLKTYFEHFDDRWVRRSLQIDHAVYSVRYLDEMRSEFIRKASFDLDIPRDIKPAGAATMNIGKDIKSKGAIKIGASNVTQNNYYGGSEADLISYRTKWLGALTGHMEAFLRKGGRFLIVLNSGPREDQDEFWRHVWQGRLETLTPLGLVLVQMVDQTEKEELHALAPDDALEIYLPNALSREAQKCAEDDLVHILVNEFGWPDEKDARVRAETIVHANRGDIPRLHRHAAGLMLHRKLRGA